MAQIDQKLQARLNAVVIGAAEEFSRLGHQVQEVTLALQDLVLELDTDGNKKAATIAAGAIDIARK